MKAGLCLLVPGVVWLYATSGAHGWAWILTAAGMFIIISGGD